jgi:drug/metabolite transporter (DMT)-like permease
VNLLQRTNQSWKIWLFAALLLVGCAATLLQGFLYKPLGKELAIQIAVGGLGLLIGGFIWAGGSVRCPKCELKILLHAVTKEGFFTWFSWLLQVESCPKCGYGEAPRKTSSRRKVKGLKRP